MSKLSRAIYTVLHAARYQAVRVADLGHDARDTGGVPIPPRHLIYLVAGKYDIPGFLDGGRLGAQTLRDVLAKNGVDIARFETILDFGCGVGRVFRHLRPLTGAKLFGCTTTTTPP